jgi:UDP-glucose 4-epimerase
VARSDSDPKPKGKPQEEVGERKIGRVVITGVSTHWGSELARRLERDPRVESVVGIDMREPAVELEATEFLEADIRNPVISRILPSLEPEVVAHCGIVWYPEPDKPARALHDINVIGTLQLLAACEKTPSLKAIVARGSAAIYGSAAAAPAFFREEMAGQQQLSTRFQRDIGELESYFEGFARRRPGVTCCMLRYQPEIGADLDLPLVRYFTLPVVPTQLGFDPRLQLLHADDATGALVAAILNPVPGAVNVAPSGTISLTRALRLAGRPTLPLPHPLAETLLSGLSNHVLGAADLHTDGVRLLRYGRGCDNRRLREEVGYTPQYTAEEAIKDFVVKSTGKRLVPAPTVGALMGRLASALKPAEQEVPE